MNHNRTQSGNRLAWVVPCLFTLMAMPPASAAEGTTVTDGFEGPVLGEFWSTREHAGHVIFPSTERVRTGDQSVELQSVANAGQKNIELYHAFPAPVYGRASVWLYDTAVGNYVSLALRSRAAEGLNAILTAQDWDPSVYWYGAGPAGGGETTVRRTRDWHRLSIAASPDELRLEIDDSVIYAGPGGLRFEEIVLEIHGPGGQPGLSFYFDDFEFVEFTDSAQPVNNAPSFVKGPDISVDEDASPYRAAGWATAISPGPPDEADQTVTFEVTNDNPGLFAVQPAVSPDGTLAFTPAPGASGMAQVQVVLLDNGGTENGGQNASAAQFFTIRVLEALGLTLLSPRLNASFCPGTGWTIAVLASGPIPPGSQVEFLRGGQVIGSAGTVPYLLEQPAGLEEGNYTAQARLVDKDGRELARTEAVSFTVVPLCNDVALVRNYPDPEVDNLVCLLTAPGMDQYLTGGVTVFDQGEVTLEELLRFKLIIWAGLDRPGEGLTDPEVLLVQTLHSSGKSLYLLGPRVVGDTGLLTPEARGELHALAGLSPSAAEATEGVISLQCAGHGDPICDGRPGAVARSFSIDGGVQAGRLTMPDGWEVKATWEGEPVLVVHPMVCEPDQGQSRVATQAFGVGNNPEAQRLFVSTCLWLLRSGLCENLEFGLEVRQVPEGGQTGEDLVYELAISETGACLPVGLVLNEALPDGWLMRGAESADGTEYVSEQVGSQVAVYLGCGVPGTGQIVRLKLQPRQAGNFTHVVSVRAANELFDRIKHERQITTTILERPRLELRRTEPGQGILWVLGEERTYRVQDSPDLVHWSDAGTVTGPAGELSVTLDRPARFFRAVYP